jgi:hypothetical protein
MNWEVRTHLHRRVEEKYQKTPSVGIKGVPDEIHKGVSRDKLETEDWIIIRGTVIDSDLSHATSRLCT